MLSEAMHEMRSRVSDMIATQTCYNAAQLAGLQNRYWPNAYEIGQRFFASLRMTIVL